MSRKEIKKTITVSEIIGASVVVRDCKPVTTFLEHVKVFGEISDRKAVAVLREKNPDVSNVVLCEIKRSEITYSMSVEDFVKYGTPVSVDLED